MALPQSDINALLGRGRPFTSTDENGTTCLVFPKWALPPGLTRTDADLLIRLSPGYPDIPPDMWWFDPAVRRVDGKDIEATQVTEAYLGRSWQRWSRHLTAGQWNAGSDSLEGFLALVQTELDKAARTPVQ